MTADPDIVVTAFSKRFAAAYVRVERVEGGFVNDAKDRGGATKYGVSLRFLASEGRIDLDADGFADFDLDMDGDIDVADIRALSPMDARYLFHRCFWVPLGCETFPKGIGEALFDRGVNGGLTAARKLLQRAINRVDRSAALIDDGVIGPRTRDAFVAAVAVFGVARLLAAYRQCAAERYAAIVARDRSQARFLDGWLRRAAALGVGA